MVSRAWSLRACGSVNPIIEKQRVAALEREPESEGRVRECLVTRIERSTVMVGQEKAEALMMVIGHRPFANGQPRRLTTHQIVDQPFI